MRPMRFTELACGLQNLEPSSSLRDETRFHSQGYGQHRARSVSHWCAPHDRNFERLNDSFKNITHGRAAGHRWLTFRKFAEDHCAHAFEFSCLPQMNERAIDLIGLHRAVFQQQNRAAGLDFPGRD